MAETEQRRDVEAMRIRLAGAVASDGAQGATP